MSKLVIGGLFSLLFFTVYFVFVVTGYQMHVLCSALEGRVSKMPDWKKLGALFHEGIQPVLIILAYSSPIIGLFIMEMNLQAAGTFKTVYLWPFELLLIIVISAFLPLALIRSNIKASLKPAFDLKAIARFIAENTSKYLSAWAFSLVNYMLAIIACLALLYATGLLYSKAGLPALVSGSAVTAIIACFMGFSATIVNAHVFARAYRESKPFEDDPEGEMRASMTVPPPLRKQ